MEFCPVCMLRKGLALGIDSGESSFEEAAKPTPVQPLQRFEHYELVTGEDCGAQAETRSSGHQTKQHHGEPGGGRRCDCEDH